MRKFHAFAGLLLILVLGQNAAHAHSSVVQTTPQYKTTVKDLPNEIAIRFSEEPLVISGEVINSVTVTNPQGQVISDSFTEVSGNSLIVKIDRDQSEIGTYGVRYRMASADGHVISGNYEFYLGHPSPKKSGNSGVVSSDKEWFGKHFLHLHRDHIIYATAVLVVAIGLLIWRRRAQSR